MNGETNVTAPPPAPPAGEAQPEPRILFYLLSFFIPIAGIVLGAIYLSKPDAANKEFGKICLIAALAFIAMCILAYVCYIFFIFAYVFVIIAIIALAAGAGVMKSAAALPVLSALALLALRPGRDDAGRR